MIDFLSADLPAEMNEEATQLYEMLLVAGSSAAEGQAKITELYSVPRVTALLRPSMSLGRGLTFDLRGDAAGRSWNFLLAADRRDALAKIRAEKPYLVIGSPPCTPFSQLQRLNRRRMRPEEMQRRLVEGRVLLEFAAQVYHLQLAAGRHFVHEHPASASSWAEPCMQRLRRVPGVSEAIGDQCRFGLRSAGEHGASGPAKKPTRFLSSAGCVLRELGRRCQGDHAHVRLFSGRRAADAAEYPRGLCRAILRGILAQRQREGRDPLGVARARATGTGIYELTCDDAPTVEPGSWGLHGSSNPPLPAADSVCARKLSASEVRPDPEQTRVGDEAELLLEFCAGDVWDENTGELLPPALVAAS